MKRRNNIFLLASLVIVALISSCTKIPKSAKLIPDNAFVVMRIDVKQISKKCDTDGDKSIKTDFKKILKDAGFSRPLNQKIETILDDPAEMGLDLRDPLFTYMKIDSVNLNNPEIGLVGTVYDADKFESLINDIQKEAGLKNIKKSDEIRYLSFDGGILAFNEDVFCIKIMENGKEEKAFLADMKTALNAEGDKMMYKDNFFKQMCAKGGDMQILFSYRGLFNNLPNIWLSKTFMPKELDINDISYLADIKINQGETVIDYELLTQSKEWDDYLNKCKENIRPINGDFARHISKNGLAFFGNINGSKMFETFKNMLMSTQLAKEIAMLQPLFDTIDGDMAVNIATNDTQTTMPEINFFAKTKDAKLVNFVIGTGFFNNDLQEAGKDNYSVKLSEDENETFNFGWKDNVTYVTNKTTKLAFSDAVNPFSQSDVKGCFVYGYFNFNMLNWLANIGMFGKSQSEELKEFANIFDYVKIVSKEIRKYTIHIVQRNKDKNIIQSLYFYFKGLPGRHLPAMGHAIYEEGDTNVEPMDSFQTLENY